MRRERWLSWRPQIRALRCGGAGQRSEIAGCGGASLDREASGRVGTVSVLVSVVAVRSRNAMALISDATHLVRTVWELVGEMAGLVFARKA